MQYTKGTRKHCNWDACRTSVSLSNPSTCPRECFNWFFRANRRLPSMMKAMWRGTWPHFSTRQQRDCKNPSPPPPDSGSELRRSKTGLSSGVPIEEPPAAILTRNSYAMHRPPQCMTWPMLLQEQEVTEPYVLPPMSLCGGHRALNILCSYRPSQTVVIIMSAMSTL